MLTNPVLQKKQEYEVLYSQVQTDLKAGRINGWQLDQWNRILGDIAAEIYELSKDPHWLTLKHWHYIEANKIDSQSIQERHEKMRAEQPLKDIKRKLEMIEGNQTRLLFDTNFRDN